MASSTVVERVQRLNRASAKRVIEPDTEIAGNVGPYFFPVRGSIERGLVDP